jgi:hypothetical protein
VEQAVSGRLAVTTRAKVLILAMEADCERFSLFAKRAESAADRTTRSPSGDAWLPMIRAGAASRCRW